MKRQRRQQGIPDSAQHVRPTTGVQKRVQVMLPYPFAGALDYTVPDGLAIEPGDIVQVMLRNRPETGVVWEDDFSHIPRELRPPPVRSLPPDRLKPILQKSEAAPMPHSLRRFIDWVAAYTLSSPGLVMAMALRTPQRQQASRPRLGWVLDTSAQHAGRLTPQRLKVIHYLQGASSPVTTAELADAAQVTPNIIRGLHKSGFITQSPLAAPAAAAPDPDHAPPSLSEEQQEAADFLRLRVKEAAFSATLLDGVTGSGKTEIYFEAIASCLRDNRQVLILLPEIALSAQLDERFRKRFGVSPFIWHSALGEKKRRETWQALATNEAGIVIGARSALFLPFSRLGLIVVDEEHDASFKQEEGVVYHARDMAIVRARLGNIPVILASATPSLETLANAQAGRYNHLKIRHRHGAARMPDIRLIDMRLTPPERGLFLSPPLVAALQDTAQRGEQSMLFLNRRGYAPLTLCRACGHRIECPNCTAWLVEHRARRALICHHCGHEEALPTACPACNEEHSLVPVGPGVERIVEELQTRLPDLRLLTMTSDNLSSAEEVTQAINSIQRHEVDVIIGTQMVAKGWHFPLLTLVGIVDADLGLTGGDLRASERTMQLLHQVSGRAGRGEKHGQVLLQSYIPEHPVMQAIASGDFANFAAHEAQQRKPGFWPPFGRLAALIISADNAHEADEMAQAVANKAPVLKGVQILGPAPAPLAILRGRHRRRLLIRSQRHIALQPILRAWLEPLRPKRHIRIDIDIDPISFL